MSIVNQSLVDSFFTTGFEEEYEIQFESGSKNFLGHFYDKYEAAKMLGKDVESSTPMIEGRSIDIETAKQGNKVICRGTEFEVYEVKTDGEGFTMLTLSYAND